MARVLDEEAHAARCNTILDAAQRLIQTMGYEQMTIQDILDVLHMSKGAFYHYFHSKPAVLDALVERTQHEIEDMLHPFVSDPHLSAVAKLQRFFDPFAHRSVAPKGFIADLPRVFFGDENAAVREKVYESMVRRRAPMLLDVFRQGIEEGVFIAPYSEQMGEIVLSLARGLRYSLSTFVHVYEKDGDESRFVDSVVVTCGCYTDAIERVLGAPTGCLHRLDAAVVRRWVASLRDGGNGRMGEWYDK